MNYIQEVKKFHEATGLKVGERPEVSEKSDINLRLKLIFEEFMELVEAFGTDNTNEFCTHMFETIETFKHNREFSVLHVGADLTEIIDAYIDLQYVLSGSVISNGMHEIFDMGFEIVQTSNMSKLCNNKKQLDDTLEYYRQQGVKVGHRTNQYGTVVFRLEDGKILKNKYYTKANLGGLVR